MATATPSTAQTFHNLVEAQVAMGIPRAQAMRDAATRYPHAHRQYVEAANAGQRSRAVGADIPDPIGEWDRALEAKIAAGMSKARAVAAIVRERPGLHRAYLEAYNRDHGRKVSGFYAK